MTDIPELLRAAREALLGAGVRHATIGGCARNAYAEVRATRDVDFVAEATAEGYAAVVAALDRLGLVRATVVGDPEDPVPDLEAFRDAAGRRVDVLFAKTAFERSALDRAESREPYAGVVVPVVSPEDLVVYKLVAGRTQDWADIEAVVATLAVGGRAIDWAYVERWCTAWDVGERLTELRRRVGA